MPISPHQVTSRANSDLCSVLVIAEQRHRPVVERMAEIVAVADGFRAAVKGSTHDPLREQPAPSLFTEFGGYYSVRLDGVEVAQFAPGNVWSAYASNLPDGATYAWVEMASQPAPAARYRIKADAAMRSVVGIWDDVERTWWIGFADVDLLNDSLATYYSGVPMWRGTAGYASAATHLARLNA